MKTLIAIGKVLALFSSPLLLGLYVYDRSGGNLLAPRLAPATSVPATEMWSASSDPGGVMVSFSPEPTAGRSVATTELQPTKPMVLTSKWGAVQMTTAPESLQTPPSQSAATPTLFPGSKSFSGATLIDASTLQVNQSLSPANYPPPPGPQPQTTAAPTLFPGSKSIIIPSLTEPPPTYSSPQPTYPSPYPVNALNMRYQQPNASSVPQQGRPQQGVQQQAVPR